MSKFDAAINLLRTEANRKRVYANAANRTIESNARYADAQLKYADEYDAAIRVLEAAAKEPLDIAELLKAVLEARGDTIPMGPYAYPALPEEEK